ncbi:hypothetical protein QBC34DRAFT_442797 [Podospora aff. communis PSN243]|uniref:MYND-type domain-containing protein n=1 Tax=Podospora aff. communis PSN243 TaxID=3040156 RepID=A0AAV9G9S2_9PEZI|nr:hypothetical protein QBC34DRAFT_442797 [Podospora aff. communis PSN243]
MEPNAKPRRVPKPNVDENRENLKFIEELKRYAGGKPPQPKVSVPKPKRETKPNPAKKTETSSQRSTGNTTSKKTKDGFKASSTASKPQAKTFFEKPNHQPSSHYASLAARYGSHHFAPEFPHRMLNEYYKQQGWVRKHDIVAKIPQQGTIGWDRTVVAPMPRRYEPPGWKQHPPEGNGTQPSSPPNEHEIVTIIGPNLPRRFRRHPSRTRIKPFKHPKTDSSSTERPPRRGPRVYSHPETPTRHWDREAWPEETSILPFTIPLSSINRLDNIRHSQIREICELDRLPHWRRCVMCQDRSSSRWKCTGCGEAWYCGPSCMMDDAPMHKRICDAFAPNGRFTELFRQSQDHFRALVWPAQSKAPELRWIHIHHSAYRRDPLDSDSDSDSEPAGPSLSFHHPEFWSFAKDFPKSAFSPHMFILGCLNQSLAFKHRPLGAGLFLLEWALPPTTDLHPSWANQSITSLGNPGDIWYWPGPQLIISLDTSHPTLTLRDVTPRDFRHVIDYFQLNLRNPVLSDDLFRFPPEERSLALKLTYTAQPLARVMGIPPTPQITQVAIASAPPFANEGWSALCAALELNWIFRDAICHGREFDWLYDRHKNLTVVSPAFRGIYTVHRDKKEFFKSPCPRLGRLLSSGDGIVVAHRTGGMLYAEHLKALVEYVQGWRVSVGASREEREALARTVRVLLENGREGFERFWAYYRAREGLVAARDIPGPYELEERYGRDAVCVGRMVVLGVQLAKKKALWRWWELEKGDEKEEDEAVKGKGKGKASEEKSSEKKASGEKRNPSQEALCPVQHSADSSPPFLRRPVLNGAINEKDFLNSSINQKDLLNFELLLAKAALPTILSTRPKDTNKGTQESVPNSQDAIYTTCFHFVKDLFFEIIYAKASQAETCIE